MRVLEVMSRDPMTKVEVNPVHNWLLWMVLLVNKWFKGVLLLVKLELLTAGHLVRVLEPMSMDPMTKEMFSLEHNFLLQLVLLATKWFKAVLLLVRLVLLPMLPEW